MKIRNYIEFLVENLILDIMENSNVCTCDHCKMDVMAISLNNLPTKYVVTQKGVLYAKLTSLQAQFEADVVTEIVKACAIVKNNPRHE